MGDKCLNCGYEYNDGDKFCAKCGLKISSDNKNNIKIAIKQFESIVSKRHSKTSGVKFNSQSLKKFFDSSAFAALVFLIVMLIVLCVSLLYILKKHENQRISLQFKNYMQNPAQIPYLKQPKTYDELNKIIYSVDEFFLLYLQKSDDVQDRKNQVLETYLTELDKLPLILSQEFPSENIYECKNVKDISKCSSALNSKFKNTSINIYDDLDKIYLYPDYKYINNRYKKYFSKSYKEYLDLRSKHNIPTSLGLNLYVKPKELADRIYDFEKLYLTTDNEFIKDELEKNIYYDLRKFIFAPMIYSTQTQEMRSEFKNAYLYFINTKKDSGFRPLIMSYMDKKRAYSESNFEADYPYKKINLQDFNQNVKNSTLNDIFVQLRKNVFDKKQENLPLSFIYDIKAKKWAKYNSSIQLDSNHLLVTEPDESNNVSIYNYAYSPMQELNILKYGKLYLINNDLYVFNKDKLSISRITYNGKTFNLYNLNHVDVTSLFPGIEVINIDSFSSYNVVIDKDNKAASYIILSRYSQGWNDYELVKSKGEFTQLLLPNMFSVKSQGDVVVLFSGIKEDLEQLHENKPMYKFTIHTLGYKDPEPVQKEYIDYDEKTKKEQVDEKDSMPNMMPKINDSSEGDIYFEDNLLVVPEQKIDPPEEKDDM